MALVAGGNAPYAPPATVIEVLSRYRERGMTTPFTAEVLERAGVSETLSSRTLQALKLLDFVDSEGNPTAEFSDIARAPEADYKERLGEMLCATYAEVLSFSDPATDPYERVRDAFRAFNPRGQQERMVTLFLGLLEYAGLDTSTATAARKRGEPRDTGGAGKANGTRRGVMGANKSGTPSKKAAKKDTKAETVVELNDGGLPPGLVGLLHQIPRGGAAWTTVRRDAFMAAFAAVLDFTIPVDDNPIPVIAQLDDAEEEDDL